MTIALFFASTLPVGAVTLLRDPDIEHALDTIAKPILVAAGLSPSQVRVLVIKDRTMNAFIVDSSHIFIHSGLIMRLGSTAELQAVIAHEAAHIANGHIMRRVANMQTAKNVAGIGMALAAVAAVSGSGQAAGALGIGISSSANRVLMGHTRAEENSADQSSVRFLARAGADPQGAVAVMQMFAGQELLSANRQDPYARTHPLSRDRLRHMKALASAYSGKAKIDPTADYWFSRAKGKLTAFLRAPKWTHKRARESASQDIRLMREAIAYHRDSNTAKALATMKRLLTLKPRDPFYRELQGQILLESRKYPAAANAYKAAVKLAPRNALILGAYGHSLLALGNAKAALSVLEKASTRDNQDARILRDLGQAYAKRGNPGMASLATAERYALTGKLKDAAIHAKRAAGMLPEDRPVGKRHRMCFLPQTPHAKNEQETPRDETLSDRRAHAMPCAGDSSRCLRSQLYERHRADCLPGRNPGLPARQSRSHHGSRQGSGRPGKHREGCG
nr:M48 family metalloprotease [Aquicoccus sp. G2-2]MEA1112776.1 M48 family metalloprotease [Aquicoccus sp. G2-2]